MRSKTLFSNHFLNTRLVQMPEWKEDPLPTLERVRELWQTAATHGATWNEAQTEQEFIQPVLTALGWEFIVQAKSKRSGQVTRPDYALFAVKTAKDDAYRHQGDDDAFYSRALAIAEAKHWGRPLSQKDASGRTTWKTESNPSHQMVSYLTGTRTEWGILTNGRVWRLYSREVSSTASEFYEVDLGEVFDFLPIGADPSPEQVDAFKRWWLFFRREAFVPQAHGHSFVRRVQEGSALYAREISDKLKELVFKEVMPEIAGGFVAYRYHQLKITEETSESLQEIYRASLSLLYKMLFLLYAEARNLLPMDKPDYRAHSLTAIAEWAAEQIDQKRRLSSATHATPYYEKLLALFRRIDQGDQDLSIPEYNGGLFSSKNAANIFLEKHKLSDRAVARAVDLLVRDAGQPVDYAFISVRNLGAIYEGLLENKLKVVDAAEGKVELINDKGERKATGSYYTPDYIVEYIVRNTLDPILDRRGEDYAAAMEQVTRLRRKLQKEGNPATVRHLRDELHEAERAAREAFLGIKVLDPAMGSGHFLVNAVDHLTDGIIRRMQAWHDAHPESLWEWDPIQQLIEKVRTEIQSELQKRGLPFDSRLNDDTALLMRLVMKRCIYGVDLNEMAVELARVSLWLHTFTVGAPLSFLDHHLRCGNSLIGADVRTVEAAMRGQGSKHGGTQFSLFAGPFAGLLDLTGVMVEVAERADATLADVRQSAEAFDAFQQALSPYKEILDLWVSQYFGNRNALEFLSLFGDDVLPAIRGEREVDPKYQAALEKARRLRHEKRFFHWDLEFPEAFIDLRKRDWAENGGFDAVIGNPPYVRQEGISEDKVFLRSKYGAFHSGADLYVYFLELGIFTCKEKGGLGLIVSNKFIRASYGKPIREKILSSGILRKIIDFGELPVFEQAATFPAIIIFTKESDARQQLVEVTRVKKLGFSSLDNLVKDAAYSVDDTSLLSDGWSLSEKAVSHLVKKITDHGIALSLYLKTEPYFGVKTGLNEAFIINLQQKQNIVEKQEACAPFIHPLIIGDDVRNYVIDYRERYIIVIPSGWTEKRSQCVNEKDAWDWFSMHYKPLADHLSSYEKQARRRTDKGVYWWELRPCDYYDLIEKPKIVYPDIAKESRFALDDAGMYPVNTVYFLPSRDLYLLSVLNSRLVFFFMKQTSSVLGDAESGGRLRFFGQYMAKLPIRKINFTTPAETRTAGVARLRKLVEAGRMDETLVEAKRHLPEQADVIHDLLAWLAEQMIEMHSSRQAEMKGFLAWLSREIGADLDGLTGKTTLFNYLGDYQKGESKAPLTAILDVLRKNQKKLTVNVASRAFQKTLEKEYEASLAKLRPIKSRLAAVDALIDQVVYALYGLEEEEIAIIEGNCAGAVAERQE